MPFEAEGLKFDSEEEYHFHCWCEELVERGVLAGFERGTSIEVIPHVTVAMGKKVKKAKVLLRSLNYTPDFNLRWSADPLTEKFCGCLGERKPLSFTFDKRMGIISVVDVKGQFAGKYNNSAVTFPLIQKILYHTHGIYVQKIVPKELFPFTFLPAKLMTTKTGRRKKWNGSPVSIDEFLAMG